MLWVAAAAAAAAAAPAWQFEVSQEVPAFVGQRLPELLGPSPPVRATLLAVGGPAAAAVIPPAEVAALGGDGFIVRWASGARNDTVAVASRTGLGAAHGAFYLLRRLGFAWLHPMKVAAPPPGAPVDPSGLDIRREPRVRVRGSHVHAEHPTELCNMLNGFDANGGWQSRADWELLLPEWHAYLEWLVANGQNAVEWSLLSAKRYAAFDESPERQRRLAALAAAATARGLAVGIDAPFSQAQEHGWRLMRKQHNSTDAAWGEVRARLDWLLGAGFTHVQCELGSSEQSEGGSVAVLVALLNRTAAYLADRGAVLMVESHISTGQTAAGLPDPTDPSRDINFNWLTYYLDPRIVSRPHTVQVYTLSDPAPVYGNTNFSSLATFIDLMEGKGRSVQWYPETGYWCNYDTTVPLFLPLYALARVRDLDGLLERHPGLEGQWLFESGFRWGYWLPNVVAAEAQWAAPQRGVPPAGRLAQLTRAVLAPLGPGAAAVADALSALAQHQHRLLVEGRPSEAAPPLPDVALVNGMAYMEGWDSQADLLAFLARAGVIKGAVTTQPQRITPQQLLRGDAGALATYREHVDPLLGAMAAQFAADSAAIAAAAAAVNRTAAAADLAAELADAARVFALRAAQVRPLYQYAATCGPARGAPPQANCSGLLAAAEAAVAEAQRIVPRQEARYGLFANGSARLWAYGFGVNPTAYGYGHSWPVHRLYYWRRDHALVAQGIDNPCFASILTPLDVMRGGGVTYTAEQLMADAERALSGTELHYLTDCLTQTQPPPFS
eukprot:TRINITY_DN2701_c0_g2_i1.p1 TRINITY_DN2701_c0_g2~~TRINITY_DN2701_c0_g2_i1.p1  ORF type:complete len:806 (+),score=279.42 TRINITY_DN2701_c0_g2_i1:73-2418(+)